MSETRETCAQYIARTGDSSGYKPRPASEPCGYPIASIERLNAYRARVEAGQDWRHPDDSSAMATKEQLEIMRAEVYRVARQEHPRKCP
jgi:hypothetical protein